MTSSAVDAIVILTRMPEYYQIADNAPFTSNAWERLRLLTELFMVSDCGVLMVDITASTSNYLSCCRNIFRDCKWSGL